MTESIVSARGVTKVFHEGGQDVRALRGIELEVREGEFIALVGPSGSGKTTLLNLIGALDIPTSGELTVLGRHVAALSKAERADMRLRSVGFVFQAFNLVPVLTALENVEFVLELQGASGARRERARTVLSELGLGALAHRRPAELSGGQQQRVAVARAVASQPKLVLADEPTGALDAPTGVHVLEALERVNRDLGATTAVITHNAVIGTMADRVLVMSGGRIASERRNERRASPAGLSW